MTSLAKLVYVNHRDDDDSFTAEDQDRMLSLAYENLEEMPYSMMYNYGMTCLTLDVSHNRFSCLDFLEMFENLTSLILDHNDVDSNTVFPPMPTLELLWLNHNKVTSLFPFIRNLHKSCPNLRYLSLMDNPAAPSYLNGGTFYEYLQYRLFVISWFPRLAHLDDRAVTTDQIEEAHRLFKRPLLERLSSDSYSPYIQVIQNKVRILITSVDKFFPKRNENRSAIV